MSHRNILRAFEPGPSKSWKDRFFGAAEAVHSIGNAIQRLVLGVIMSGAFFLVYGSCVAVVYLTIKHWGPWSGLALFAGIWLAALVGGFGGSLFELVLWASKGKSERELAARVWIGVGAAVYAISVVLSLRMTGADLQSFELSSLLFLMIAAACGGAVYGWIRKTLGQALVRELERDDEV